MEEKLVPIHGNHMIEDHGNWVPQHDSILASDSGSNFVI